MTTVSLLVDGLSKGPQESDHRESHQEALLHQALCICYIAGSRFVVFCLERQKMLNINLSREDKGHNPEIIRESQRRRFTNVDLVDESGGDASEVIRSTEENKKLIAEKETEVQEARAALYSKLEIIGNLVHDSVPVDNDEANNAIIQSWGENGANVAGGRGFYLKGDGVRLNQALINFGLDFYGEKGVHCIANSILYEERYHGKVTGEGDDKYLIATAEQPLCAYHLDDWIHPSQLPIRYAGYSSCFRKEAGSHGRDTLGIFRVHQFEKVEQFCLTSPNGNDSRDMHEEMITNSEEFYKMSNEQAKQYVHLLNSTLTATERTTCCILENYQREDGVEIPEVLREYMGRKTFLPFQIEPVKEAKGKKSKA
ncbi:hypothetical protein HYC85_021695 [Camellia sinensis]|uniref:serine--tRNA ligase n=1 Tax=Camellia sinensis TaxID=4442 RepID=A0A7J7GMB8_CAMSI|nr:hypothetical protein HYC85_021695 [Camellia sinensis]